LPEARQDLGLTPKIQTKSLTFTTSFFLLPKTDPPPKNYSLLSPLFRPKNSSSLHGLVPSPFHHPKMAKNDEL
jgi:hypothetical protein